MPRGRCCARRSRRSACPCSARSPRDAGARGARAPPRPRPGGRARAAGPRGDRARSARRSPAHCDLEALVRAGARRRPARRARAWSPRRRREPRRRRARVAIAARRRRSPSTTRRTSSCCAAAGAELRRVRPARRRGAARRRRRARPRAAASPRSSAPSCRANAALRAEIARLRRAAARPVLAECGGLLYLARDARRPPDVRRARRRRARMTRAGSRSATARRRPPADHAVWPAGTAVRGHEFHYSRVDPPRRADARLALRARGAERPEGHVAGGVHASYLHTHWAATPEVAARGRPRPPRAGSRRRA